jgi:hypothetical protein
MAKEEITKQDGGSLVTLPDHLKGVSGHDGMELVRKQDLVIPRLGISQGNNPQMKRANPLYIDGLKDGNFFNPVTNDVYGDSFQFIALSFGPSRIYFHPIDEGGGIICRSNNGIDGGTIAPTCDQCPNSRWGAKGESPACTEFMNFPFVILGAQQLVISSWKSTALKPTRTWLTKMNMLVEKWNKPFYAWVSEVKLNPDKNDAGEWFVPTFTVKRWATSEEFKFAEELSNGLKGKSIGKMVVTEEEKNRQQAADPDLAF